jgi:ribosomal protein L7/L12
MHPISLIFLGLCVFLLGFWLIRRLERRKVRSASPQVTLPPSQVSHTRPAHSAEATPIESAQPAEVNCEPTSVEAHDIRDLILENRQSEAIQVLHNQQGWDLEHAKAYVEQQEQRQSSKQLDPEVVAAAQKLLAENRKIVAVKLIYEHTGWSLKAAKDYVENSL